MDTSKPEPDPSGPIAHELNNVLTVLRTYIHFARQPTTREQQGRDLTVVAAAAERAGALVDWFASRSESKHRGADEVSANEFVSQASARLEQLISAGASVEIMRVGPDVVFHANRLRLEHVVMSLVLAASQRSSQIAFKFAVQRVSVPEHAPSGLAAGEYALLEIRCTRVPNSNNWKEPVARTGDQLAALLPPLADLLNTMSGRLEVIAEGEEDSRFEFLLPAVEVPVGQSTGQRLVLRPPGAQMVCLIENESALRRAMLRALAGAGYFVLEANDGIAARKLLISNGSAVKLLICDVGELDRDEDFFRWVKATCPHATLLLISGKHAIGAARASSLRARFLAKPFLPSQLLRVAREIGARAAQVERGHSAEEGRLVVLVVDDEQVTRDSLVRLLGERDFLTIAASTAQHALQILKERHVDAIVVDQVLPALDGVALLGVVANFYPGCTRLLCTGHPASVAVRHALDEGRVHCVLQKTMHAVALRDEIERAVLDGKAAQFEG